MADPTQFCDVFGETRETTDDAESLHKTARNAVKAGYAVLPVHPGEKRPMCPLTSTAYKKANEEAAFAARDAGRHDWVRVKHDCGVYHATLDVHTVELWANRLYKKHPDLNLAIEVGKSRILTVDADNAADVDAFHRLWEEKSGKTGLVGKNPHVTTPGKRNIDGEWVHKGGGHWHFTLPDGVDFSGASTADPLMYGNTAVYFKDRIILVPPSVRPEGAYLLRSEPQEAPQWLIDDVTAHIAVKAERRATKSLSKKEWAGTGEDPIDVWSRETEWSELLDEDGWTAYKVEGCGCPNYTRPGHTGKSAVAHEVDCTRIDFSDKGHGFFHVWSDNPPDFLTDGNDFTKLQYIARRDFNGDSGAAKRALGLVGGGMHSGGDAWDLVTTEEKAAYLNPGPVNAVEALQVLPKPTHAASGGEQSDGMSQMVSGAAFLLDDEDDPDPLWGDGDKVIWPNGEGLIIGAVQGVGKSTLACQLVFAMLGIVDAEVLGFTVKPAKRVLYLAMDRPRQLRRAARRVVNEEHRAALETRLVVWKGPPPGDLAQNTDMLTAMAEKADADVVVVDSLKDAALKLSEDETGSGWNRAAQKLIQSGRNLLVLHHVRKRGRGDNEKSGIDDFYGSTWLTSGMGSVIHLAGDPGDPVVKLRHYKVPVEEVGPFQVLHDQTAGLMSVQGEVDLLALTRSLGELTCKRAAQLRYADGDIDYKPTQNEKNKVGRELKGLVDRGLLQDAKDGQTIIYKPVVVQGLAA